MGSIKFRFAAIAVTLVAVLTGSFADAATLIYTQLQWDGDPQNPRISQIRAIDTDGANDKLLVDLGGDTTYPQPSPDGQWLYFQSNAGGAYAGYRSRADGGNVVKISAAAVSQLAGDWTGSGTGTPSANGNKITYGVFNDNLAKVVVADPDGSNPQLAAPLLGYTYMSSLNFVGDRVVFSGPTENYRLITVSLPDGTPQILTPDHPQSYAPQFTPDGNKIIFTRIDGDIYSIEVGGANLQRLTNGNGYVEFRWSALDEHGSTDRPDISPDGNRIAYIAMVNGVQQVHTMNLDGSDKRQVTTGATSSGRVRWSPDGQQLAFVTFVEKYPQLFVAKADGSQLQQLTHLTDSGAYWVEWQPAVAVPEPSSIGSLTMGSLWLIAFQRRNNWSRLCGLLASSEENSGDEL